jgi:flagellar assembly protein FliH
MLSKVLKESAAEVTPVAWPRYAAAPGKPAMPSLPAPENESAQLRSQLAESISAGERQSREAYQAGFQAGEAAARQALEQEQQPLIERLAQTIAEIADLRAETMQRAEADTVRLAIEIARRILHRELAVDSSALEALIKAALEKLQYQEVYRVRVHPDQAKLVRSCLDQTGRSQAIELIEDASRPKGAALFEVSRGALDASVDTQLREIECGLIDRLEVRG